MNVDAKIVSKAFAKGMKKVLGRYIGESICLISDILEYVDENELSGILFSADFEKAIDSIEYPFIFATLQSFAFGLEFIQWVRMFLKGVESCVLNNGHSTGFSTGKRNPARRSTVCISFHHPLSRRLFIQIRDNRGIRVGGHEI